ncbi:unnamed protein product, partial [Amoebophrya sp. A25]
VTISIPASSSSQIPASPTSAATGSSAIANGGKKEVVKEGFTIVIPDISEELPASMNTSSSTTASTSSSVRVFEKEGLTISAPASTTSAASSTTCPPASAVLTENTAPEPILVDSQEGNVEKAGSEGEDLVRSRLKAEMARQKAEMEAQMIDQRRQYEALIREKEDAWAKVLAALQQAQAEDPVGVAVNAVGGAQASGEQPLLFQPGPTAPSSKTSGEAFHNELEGRKVDEIDDPAVVPTFKHQPPSVNSSKEAKVFETTSTDYFLEAAISGAGDTTPGGAGRSSMMDASPPRIDIEDSVS